MSLQRNFYEVLGIPPGATPDEIKKKYRELARKFHPDVVQDKVLGQRVFSQINQAYHVLGDPDRRAQYNVTLSSTAGRADAPPPSSPPPRTATASPSSSSAAASIRPNHAAATPTPPAAASQTGSRQNGTVPPRANQPGPAPNGTVQKAQAVSGLLANADNAIMAGKPIEARAFCAKVLEIEPRNARALEMLGDALVQMGQREEAAVHYRSALAAAPSSLIQAKLNRLEQSAAPTRTNPPSEDGEKPGGGLFGRFLGRK